jgi:hypothetical protein
VLVHYWYVDDAKWVLVISHVAQFSILLDNAVEVRDVKSFELGEGAVGIKI